MAATGNLPPMARPWAAASAKWSGQDIERNRAFFNLPEMLDMPSNFFGPEGPADPTGLSRDMRYQVATVPGPPYRVLTHSNRRGCSPL